MARRFSAVCRKRLELNLKWQVMDPANPPTCSGVYAICRHGVCTYIGRAKDIARRIRHPRHPVQITRGLDGLSFFYAPVDSGLGSIEHQLLQLYEPEWNGGTAHGVHIGKAVPQGPYCYWDGGISDAAVLAAIGA